MVVWLGRGFMGMIALTLLAACDEGAAIPQQPDAASTSPETPDSGDDAEQQAAAADESHARPPMDGTDGEQATAVVGENDDNPAEAPPAERDSAASDNPPETAEKHEHRLDLERLFIQDAPLVERKLSPAVEAALDDVRAAMRERDFLNVRRNLQDAATRLDSEADNAAYEEMLRVHALWTQGWNEASVAARLLKTGDTLDTWSGPAAVHETSDTEVVLNLDGAPQTFAIRSGEMDVRLAAALLLRRANATGLGLDAQGAALWVLDREGTPEAARQACVDAAQRGIYIDPLIRELRQRGWGEAATPVSE